jgi:hypothetical protein
MAVKLPIDAPIILYKIPNSVPYRSPLATGVIGGIGAISTWANCRKIIAAGPYIPKEEANNLISSSPLIEVRKD